MFVMFCFFDDEAAVLCPDLLTEICIDMILWYDMLTLKWQWKNHMKL